MGFTGNFFHKLKLESKADLVSPAGLLEETVEIPFPSPKPPPLTVKGHSGHDGQIQRRRISDPFGIKRRLQNPVGAGLKLAPAPDLDHLELLRLKIQSRHIRLLLLPENFIQKGPGLDFLLPGQIKKNRPGI